MKVHFLFLISFGIARNTTNTVEPTTATVAPTTKETEVTTEENPATTITEVQKETTAKVTTTTSTTTTTTTTASTEAPVITTEAYTIAPPLTEERKECWKNELGKYQAGFCIKNTIPHNCGLNEPYLIVAHIGCKEELMSGVSRLGISVFFTCFSILIMIILNWRYEMISSSAYSYTRIVTIILVSLALIATFIGMKNNEPLHRRVPSGIFSAVMGAFSVLSAGYMMVLRGQARHV